VKSIKENRKQFLSDRPFQMQLLLKLGGINLLQAGVMTFLFFVIAQDIISILVLRHEIPLPDASYVFIFKNIPYTIIYFIVLIAFILLHALLTIRISHRIAGPVFGMTQKIKGIRKGRLGRQLKLRNKDFGKELAGELDGLRSDLKSRISHISQDVVELDQLVKELNTALQDEKQEVSHDIQDKINLLKKELEFFQTDKEN